MPDSGIERSFRGGDGLPFRVGDGLRSFNTRTRGFSNSRDWRSFLSAAQPTVYINVAEALKAGHAWLTGRGWAHGWLGARGSEICSRWAEAD